MMLWCDLETTGLNPLTGDMLEGCFRLTSNDLKTISQFTVIIKPDQWELKRNRLDDFIVNMHTESGLLADVDILGMPKDEAEIQVYEWIYALGLERPTMCGSSVGFDRNWLEVHMPSVHGLFGYRNIDVSTLKELVARWYTGEYKFIKPGQAVHRGQADLDHSIAELSFYRDNILVPF